MLSQQESFKLGERSPSKEGYYCVACDRRRTVTTVDLNAAEPFPFCPVCRELGRDETDQLWVRVAERDAWRERERTRWRELWGVPGSN